jgi:hypothetical protein
MRFGHGSHLSLTVCIQEGAAQSFLLYVAIMEHVFLLHSEVRGGEWHGSRDLRTSNGGSSLCTNEKLAWCFGIPGSGMQVGATTHVKFNVLSFVVKFQSLALIGCVQQ